MAFCIIDIGSHVKRLYNKETNMKKYILYICLFCCTTMNGQIIEKISVTANIGTNYASFLIPKASSSRGYGQAIDEKVKMIPVFFPRLGIGSRLLLGKKWSVGTGFNYEERGWYRDKNLAFDIDSLHATYHKFEFYYRYLSIPVDITRQLGSKKRFSISFGYVLGIPLPLKGRGIYSDNLKLSPISKIQPSRYLENGLYADHAATLGIGYKRKIVDELDLNVRLNYQLSLNPIERGESWVVASHMNHQAFTGLLEFQYPLSKLWKKKGT